MVLEKVLLLGLQIIQTSHPGSHFWSSWSQHNSRENSPDLRQSGCLYRLLSRRTNCRRTYVLVFFSIGDGTYSGGARTETNPKVYGILANSGWGLVVLGGAGLYTMVVDKWYRIKVGIIKLTSVVLFCKPSPAIRIPEPGVRTYDIYVHPENAYATPEITDNTCYHANCTP